MGAAAGPFPPLLPAWLPLALLAGACGSAAAACRVTASTCHTTGTRTLVSGATVMGYSWSSKAMLLSQTSTAVRQPLQGLG